MESQLLTVKQGKITIRAVPIKRHLRTDAIDDIDLSTYVQAQQGLGCDFVAMVAVGNHLLIAFEDADADSTAGRDQ